MIRFIGIIVLIVLFCLQSVSAAILTPAGIDREASSAITVIKSPVWREWAQTRVDYLKQILWATRNRSIHQKIIAHATKFLSDLKNGVYTYDVSSNERVLSEKIILEYQKEFVKVLKRHINTYNTQDKKENGNMHFAIQLNDYNRKMDVIIDLSPYKIIISKDLENMEIDGKIDVSITETEDRKMQKSTHFMIDGNMRLIKNDLYFMLRNYNLKYTDTTENIPWYLEEFRDIFSEIKWKDYHYSFNDTYSYRSILSTFALKNREGQSEKIIQKIQSVLDILMVEPILSPVAKKWESMILGINTKTLFSIGRLMPEMKETLSKVNIDTLSDIYNVLPIAADIQLIGNRLSTIGMTADVWYSGQLDRLSDGTPVFMLSIDDLTGISELQKIIISKTSTYLWFAASATMGGEPVDLTAQAKKDGMTASISLKGKEFATAQLHEIGSKTWNYDFAFTNIWANPNELQTFHLWWDLWEEFGIFTIIPPSISSEVTDIQTYKKQRDDTRKTAIISIEQDILDFYDAKNTYPIAPRSGCVTDIRAKTSYGWNIFSYSEDPNGQSAWTCPNGYYYRTLRDYDNELVYLIAAHTETREAANYDNSRVDITQAPFRTIMNNVGTGISSADPKNWYLITMPYLSSDSIEDTLTPMLVPSLGCELNGICN
jgi:hypothetical protein